MVSRSLKLLMQVLKSLSKLKLISKLCRSLSRSLTMRWRNSQYFIAAEHPAQAVYEAQREFGIDLGSLNFRTLKDYLAHEQDMLCLRIMVWRTLHKEHFDVALPQTQTFDVWATIIKGKFQTVYSHIIE